MGDENYVKWLHFCHRPPCYSGMMMFTVPPQDAPILRTAIHALLEKHATEVLPLDDSEYSCYFLGSKKDSGLQPILDLRPLNSALSLRSFKIITIKQIHMHVRPRDLLISVDLLSPSDSPSQALSEICL